jgi:hypothetical protein
MAEEIDCPLNPNKKSRKCDCVCCDALLEKISRIRGFLCKLCIWVTNAKSMTDYDFCQGDSVWDDKAEKVKEGVGLMPVCINVLFESEKQLEEMEKEKFISLDLESFVPEGAMMAPEEDVDVIAKGLDYQGKDQKDRRFAIHLNLITDMSDKLDRGNYEDLLNEYNALEEQLDKVSHGIVE